jgi:hypothetical protein
MTDENIKQKESISIHLATIDKIVKAEKNYEIIIKAPPEVGPEYPNRLVVSSQDAIYIMNHYKDFNYKGQEVVAFYDTIDKKLVGLIAYPEYEKKKQQPF